jgi:exodeoxyribonuclease-3
VDAFRRVNKDSDEYSWWPAGTKGTGDGWRTDFQVVSNSIGPKVEYATIYKTQQFSSHMPVIIDYDIELAP